jgi:hypothetical protein
MNHRGRLDCVGSITSLMFFFPPPMTIMNFLLSQFLE